ncbi:uncharacterized protein KD926_002736 [Aspergillus affinis]|uniref:uncharacterized protein n=1 Tax=Aspergillus affinis TaxID=1070780 RepID=UPI0022FE7F9F|nr:uncharacterized protein KD926_002736 [Aspergillus affinis]KAI9043845.1 hypothetical protein KD926_002736 [Aspergillus affinis]
MPTFESFYDFYVQTLPTILLYSLIILDSLYYYVIPTETIDRDHLIFTNLSTCIFIVAVNSRKASSRRMAQINLTELLDAEMATISARDSAVNLAERTPMNVCQATIVAQACLGILDHVINYSQALGAAIKSLSDQHNCRCMTGTFDNIKWSFHATGQHCDSTTQQKTIAGAIAKYIRNAEHGKICGT